MVDYNRIADWELTLIREKPEFGIPLTPEEEKAVKSRPLPPLPNYLQHLKDTDRVKFIENHLRVASLTPVNNYRENYIVRVLFLQALKKRLLPEFGTEADERDYQWRRRYYKWAKQGLTALGLGSLAVFNLGYMVPRYSMYGMGLTLLGNASIAGTLYMLSQPLLKPLAVRTMISHHRLADKYRNLLLELHRKNKLIYQYEPATTVFPPSTYQGEEDEFNTKMKIYQRATQDRGTILGEIKTRLVSYDP